MATIPAPALDARSFDINWSALSASGKIALSSYLRALADFTAVSTRSTANLRPLLDDAAKATLRKRLVQDIWEPELRADLVDRVVNLVACGAVSTAELQAAVRQARESKTLWSNTNGRQGQVIWRTFGSIVKGWTERAGIAWTSTSSAVEPKPEQRRSIAQDAIDRIERQSRGE